MKSLLLLQVQDLHAVSPRSFLEVSGGILHGLSYQQARNNTSHVGQVRLDQPWLLRPLHMAFPHSLA